MRKYVSLECGHVKRREKKRGNGWGRGRVLIDGLAEQLDPVYLKWEADYEMVEGAVQSGTLVDQVGIGRAES